MAYTTIDNPGLYFNTKLYTGNGTAIGSGGQAITGVGFQPDWVWIKDRTDSDRPRMFDAVRGVTKALDTSDTTAESTLSEGLTAFGSDGFTVGNHAGVNSSSDNFVAWNWLGANGTASNSNGSITSTVSASATSGFSIVSWTGSGSDATIGHGLSSAPEMYVVKNRSDSADWRVGQTVSGNIMTGGNGYYMEWNDTKASSNPGSAVTWGSTPTAPTASLFTVGSNNAHNGSSDNMIAYCFHSVKGYQKIGSFTGNGDNSGTFVYTGFAPAFVMVKKTSGTGNWGINDTKRDFNSTYGNDASLYVNTSGAETTSSSLNIDLLSNGMKLRSNNSSYNASGGSYLYMAIAESPFVNSAGAVPTNAR